MAEPIYIEQTKLGTRLENEAWIEERRVGAFERYCTFARVSWDDHAGLLLFEAWYEQPADQGEPRWILTDAASAPVAREQEAEHG